MFVVDLLHETLSWFQLTGYSCSLYEGRLPDILFCARHSSPGISWINFDKDTQPIYINFVSFSYARDMCVDLSHIGHAYSATV